VYHGIRKADGLGVAIKVLQAENEDFSDLKRECALLGGLRHVHVVAYHATYEHDGAYWVMYQDCCLILCSRR